MRTAQPLKIMRQFALPEEFKVMINSTNLSLRPIWSS
jgi:hypothetical protein